MQQMMPSLGLSAQLKEDMAELKLAINEAERKMRVLDEVRHLLEEYGEDNTMAGLFASLLEEAGELHTETTRLSQELGDLEETLGDVLWVCGDNASNSSEGVFS